MIFNLWFILNLLQKICFGNTMGSCIVFLVFFLGGGVAGEGCENLDILKLEILDYQVINIFLCCFNLVDTVVALSDFKPRIF